MSTESFAIRKGQEYVYARGQPVECIGSRYRVIDFVVDVPSYQQKVLVRALTGPDAGLRFVCSLANFSTRYRPLKPEEVAVG